MAFNSMKEYLSKGIVWRKEEPYPLLWNRIFGESMVSIHEGQNLTQVVEVMRGFYLKQGWGFSPADFVELSVDHIMFHRDIRIYKLTKTLVASLLGTSIRKVPGMFLRLPFPRIYLDISEHDIPVKIKGNWGTVRGIVVEEREGTLAAALIRHVPGNLGSQGQPWPFAYSLLNIPKDDEVNIPSLRSLLKDYEKSEKVFDTLAKIGVCTDRSEKNIPHSSVHKTTRHSIHILLTTLLYINSVNADIREDWLNLKTKAKWKKAKGKRKQKIKQVLQQTGRVFHMGTNLKIPNVSQPSSGTTTPTGRKITVRFRVRGHFHTFWTGSRKESSDRKRVLKWLSTYWKGSEMAEVVQEKIFEVGRRKDGKAEVDEDRTKDLEDSIRESETDAPEEWETHEH